MMSKLHSSVCTRSPYPCPCHPPTAAPLKHCTSLHISQIHQISTHRSYRFTTSVGAALGNSHATWVCTPSCVVVRAARSSSLIATLALVLCPGGVDLCIPAELPVPGCTVMRPALLDGRCAGFWRCGSGGIAYRQEKSASDQSGAYIPVYRWGSNSSDVFLVLLVQMAYLEHGQLPLDRNEALAQQGQHALHGLSTVITTLQLPIDLLPQLVRL